MANYHRVSTFDPNESTTDTEPTTQMRARTLSILSKRNPFTEASTPTADPYNPGLDPSIQEEGYFPPPNHTRHSSSTSEPKRHLLPETGIEFVASSDINQSTPKQKSRRLVHPITLIPAFLLGILVTIPLGLRNSSSSSTYYNHLIQNKTSIFQSAANSWSLFNNQKTSKHSKFKNGIESTPSQIINHRDHVYFPSDYLNKSWSLVPGQDQYPILQLIHNASLSWNAKLARQSKSLDQAVLEYQRRYHRPPPFGFEEWYTWASDNQVVLIDEFDRVNELIEPFWALPPSVLRSRTEQAGNNEAFSTFVIKDGQVKAIGSKKNAPRTMDQLKLLEVIVPHLPDVNITMSHHDGPSVFMDWVTKQRHLDYARAGKVLPPELIDSVEDDASLWGFVGACAPDSPMRMLANGLGQDLKVKGAGPGGYIGLEHAKTMDLCDHPEWQEYHGFTAWAGPRPLPLRPIFSFAQSPGFVSDILNAPLEQFEDSNKNADQVKTWDQKGNDNQLLWRGQTTGVWFDRQTNWRKSHRVRLHRLGVASNHPYGHNLKRILRTPGFLNQNNDHDPLFNENYKLDPNQLRVVEKEYSLAQLANRYLNASFVGNLVQCTVEDSSCEAISKEIEFADPVDWQFQNDFQYVLDIDGNSWSGRFRRLLKSNSIVFKSTIWPEWYRDQIQPWYHYVPVRIDYEDIFDLMSFFTGGNVHANNNNDDNNNNKSNVPGFQHLAKQIAQQGSLWADSHFRYQDIRAYVWRTYLEWARVSSDNRLDMNFKL